MITEHNLMQHIKSKHIIKAKEVYDYNDKIVIVSKYMSGGDLHKYLKNWHLKLSEESCRYMVYIIASAIKDLHDIGLIHRDLKSDNVLIRPDDGKLLLGDLGLTTTMYKNAYRKTMQGTLIFMAPEMLDGLIYNQSIDFWGLGIIMYEIAYGQPPF